MLDFFLSGLAAYNQVAMFIGAFVCLGLGGLLFGNSLYWRLMALRTEGTIIGVIPKGDSYTAVYRFTLPGGATHEAKAGVSTGWLSGYRTGRIVPLLVFSDSPSEARNANSFLYDIVGLIIMAPGFMFGYLALTSYPITWMTWAVAGAMLLFFTERVHAHIIPKDQRLSFAEWRKSRRLRPESILELADVVPAEQLLAGPASEKSRREAWQRTRNALPFLAVFTALLLGLGVWFGIKMARLEAAGERAEGEVVRLQSEYSSNDDGGDYIYYPVVRYQTGQDRIVEFKDATGSNPPAYRRGDKVPVLYLPGDPQGMAILDRGWFWNWLATGILLCVGVLLAWMTFALWRNGRAVAFPRERQG